MDNNLESEFRLSIQWISLLVKYGFTKVAEDYSPESFGNFDIKYESSHMALAFVRDKGVVSVLVGIRSKRTADVSDLDNLALVLGALGEVEPGCEPSLAELALGFDKYYAKISSIYSSNRPIGWTEALKRFQRNTFAKTAPNLLAALEAHDAQYGKDGTSSKN